MAHVQQLSNTTLQTLAKQLAGQLATMARMPITAGQFSLNESFPVWMLGLDATTRPDEDIGAIATSTGYWHHQIRSGSTALHFARSRPEGPDPEDWSVTDLVASQSAARISSAIAWIDQNVRGDPEVRVLVVPAYYIICFWLLYEDKNEIVVADMPETAPGVPAYSKISYQKIYSSSDFLKALASERHAAVLR